MSKGGLFTSGLRKAAQRSDDYSGVHGNGKKVGKRKIWVLKAAWGLEFCRERNGLNTKVLDDTYKNHCYNNFSFCKF